MFCSLLCFARLRDCLFCLFGSEAMMYEGGKTLDCISSSSLCVGEVIC
jgi:hypothetical protein